MADMTELVRQHGCSRIAAALGQAGFLVNDKPVERLWRRERLKVSARQLMRAHLRLHDSAGLQLYTERADHLCSYDIVHHGTQDGPACRMLSVLDAFTSTSLAIRV